MQSHCLGPGLGLKPTQAQDVQGWGRRRGEPARLGWAASAQTLAQTQARSVLAQEDLDGELPRGLAHPEPGVEADWAARMARRLGVQRSRTELLLGQARLVVGWAR